MTKNIIFTILLSATLCACSSSDDDVTKDMTYPEISTQNITANPVDCQQYHRGDVLAVHFVLTDDTELGAYNIEIHQNFDHHTHNTSSTECPMDAQKQPQHPWVFNQDYSIPAGLRSYDARHDLVIPADIDPGDYHFMLRLTDRAGWQQLHAVAIKVLE